MFKPASTLSHKWLTWIRRDKLNLKGLDSHHMNHPCKRPRKLVNIRWNMKPFASDINMCSSCLQCGKASSLEMLTLCYTTAMHHPDQWQSHLLILICCAKGNGKALRRICSNELFASKVPQNVAENAGAMSHFFQFSRFGYNGWLAFHYLPASTGNFHVQTCRYLKHPALPYCLCSEAPSTTNSVQVHIALLPKPMVT